MPFTPTHILAIVPIAALSRGALPFSGLAIGSMIPDLPLFVPIGPGYEITHSPRGIVTACLPLGISGFVVFQGVLKRPILALLPAFVRRRCGGIAATVSPRSLRSLLALLVAIAVGAATHLIWDAFTHDGRWGARLIPWLGPDALRIGGIPVSGAKAFQYGSSFVGLPVLLGLLAVWFRRQQPTPVEDLPGMPVAIRVATWSTLLTVAALVALAAGSSGEGTAYLRLGRSIKATGLSLMIALVAYGLIYGVAIRRGFGGRAVFPFFPRTPPIPSPLEGEGRVEGTSRERRVRPFQ